MTVSLIVGNQRHDFSCCTLERRSTVPTTEKTMPLALLKTFVCIPAAAAMLLASGAISSAACLPAPQKLLTPGTLTVGSALNAPPMGFMNVGQPSGFDTDLVSALAAKMCLKPNFVNLTFQGLFPGLLADKFDIVAARVGITEARSKIFDFVPVFVGGLRLIAKKNSGLFFKTEADVCGHPVAIEAGSTQAAALERVKNECPSDRPMVMKTFGEQIQAMNEVAKGSVDVAYVDWPLAAFVIKQRPNDFAEASPILSGRGPGTPRNRNGIMVHKGDAATKDAITSAFEAVEKDGTYDKLLAKWTLAEGDIRHASPDAQKAQ